MNDRVCYSGCVNVAFTMLENYSEGDVKRIERRTKSQIRSRADYQFVRHACVRARVLEGRQTEIHFVQRGLKRLLEFVQLVQLKIFPSHAVAILVSSNAI